MKKMMIEERLAYNKLKSLLPKKEMDELFCLSYSLTGSILSEKAILSCYKFDISMKPEDYKDFKMKIRRKGDPN